MFSGVAESDPESCVAGGGGPEVASAGATVVEDVIVWQDAFESVLVLLTVTIWVSLAALQFVSGTAPPAVRPAGVTAIF